MGVCRGGGGGTVNSVIQLTVAQSINIHVAEVDGMRWIATGMRGLTLKAETSSVVSSSALRAWRFTVRVVEMQQAAVRGGCTMRVVVGELLCVLRVRTCV